MASIDKIYGTQGQYDELHLWLKQQSADHKEAQDALKAMLPVDHPAPDGGPIRIIANFPSHVDQWLWFHCPIAWLIERLDDQYLISNKRHRYIKEFRAGRKHRYA